MAHPKVDSASVLRSLFEVFRTYGYEGATLSLLERYTGLKKASLYHRFPGGKRDMAKAVLEKIHLDVLEGVVRPLLAEGPLSKKLEKLHAGLLFFYEDGEKNCVLNALCLGEQDEMLQEMLKDIHSSWVEGLSGAAQMHGFSPDAAMLKASQFVTLLEGALVVQRVTGNTETFDQTMRMACNLFLA